MITDEMLAQAAAELADAINASLPDPDECRHTFSAEFERKMKRLIRKTNHPILYPLMRNVAAIVLVILIGFGSVLAVSAEAREAFFGWLSQLHGTFYEYYFDGESTSSKTQGYHLGWIPDGCELYTSYEIAGGEVFAYTNEQESLTQFTYTSDTDSTKMFIEVEGYIRETVTVNGHPGEIYLAINTDEVDDSNGIVWTNSDDNTIFFISGNFDKSVLMKMAESVEKNN